MIWSDQFRVTSKPPRLCGEGNARRVQVNSWPLRLLRSGSTIGINEFRGKWVVLYFYPKDGTTGCTIGAHNFQQDLSKYDAAKAVIVGVSVDTSDSHKDFCAKQGLPFKLLSDTDKKVVDTYGSLGGNGVASRNTFLIDPSGKIVKVWTKVNFNVHSKEVLETLETMEK